MHTFYIRYLLSSMYVTVESGDSLMTSVYQIKLNHRGVAIGSLPTFLHFQVIIALKYIVNFNYSRPNSDIL